MKHRRINIESILSLTNRKFTFEFIKKDYAAYALNNSRDKLKSHLIKTLRQHYNILNNDPIDDAIKSYSKLFNTIQKNLNYKMNVDYLLGKLDTISTDLVDVVEQFESVIYMSRSKMSGIMNTLEQDSKLFLWVSMQAVEEINTRINQANSKPLHIIK